MTEPEVKVAPWEDMVLWLIAIYKLAKAGITLILGLILIKLIHQDVAQFLHTYIFDPLHLDFDADSENQFLKWLFERVADLNPHLIRMSAYVSFFYALVFAVEGIGLYYKKHWAEYMVLIVTGSFLPFEGYILYHHPVWWKVLLIIGNLLIMVYLVHRLRLDARLRRQAEEEARSGASPAISVESKAVATEMQ